MQEDKIVDVLCIGAHQDDIDATLGGTLAKLVREGKRVEVVDLTLRSGMYFSEEEEWGREADEAARMLGIRRTVDDLGLLRLENDYENRVKVANIIRARQPKVLITVGRDETHPDHAVAHQLVLDAAHYAFATAIKTEHKPWRVKGIYFAPTSVLYEKMPSNAMFIDISETYEVKKEALKCYASQMLFHAHNQKYGLGYIEALNRSWGLLIGKEYAEIIIPRLPVLGSFPELDGV